MNKPDPIIQLLEELRDDVRDTSVVTIAASHARIFPTAGNQAFRLTASECEILFHSPATVTALMEALGEPLEARVEMHQLHLDDEVVEAVESAFAGVEEI